MVVVLIRFEGVMLMASIFESPRVREQSNEAVTRTGLLLRDALNNKNLTRSLYKFMEGDVRQYRALRIHGYSHCPEQENEQALYFRMRQIIAGIYQRGREFYFCVTGSEKDGISYYIGAEADDLMAIRSTLTGILEDVETEELRIMPNMIRSLAFKRSDEPFARTPAGGIITGIPSVPSEDVKNWLNPAYTIASGMNGMPFMLIFYCRAVDEELINDQIRIINEETSLASFGSELTLSGDDIHHVTEKIVIRAYKQYEEYLQRYAEFLRESQTLGAWSVTGYYLAQNETDAGRLSALVRAAFGGNGSGPEPVRCTPDKNVSRAIDTAQRFLENPIEPHPMKVDRSKTGFSTLYTTQLSGAQLAACCMLPDQELPGFFVNESARFDLTPRRAAGTDDLFLGTVMQSPYFEQPAGEYRFSFPDLDRHALVVGATGGGKSNTIRSMLKTLTEQKKLSFMVIESAKSEYWELANFGIPVCALQLGAYDAPFRLNPFECEKGFPLQTHVDSLLSTFKAAFEMYPPMPFILEQSVYAVYADYGWDVATGENKRGIRQYPTLDDLYWQIPLTVEKSAYDKEIKDNVTGSLQTRVRSLMIGGKGQMMNCRQSTPLPALLRQSLILELENLGDDDTKAFVIGLLMSRLYEVRRVESGGSRRPLSHLLIIEEAHRLLKRVENAGEAGNPRAASVEFFCNMLAEIRSYGQGILIADQSPEKLAQDAVRNTNLKIVHRIVDTQDRETVAGAMHMDERQKEALTLLRRGVAAVYAEGDHRPRLVKMPLMTSKAVRTRTDVLNESKRQAVFRMAAAAPGIYPTCRYCEYGKSGRCMNASLKGESQRKAGRPLTDPQCRYYEQEIRKNGPDGALLWQILLFAIEKDAADRGRDAESARREMDAMKKDQFLCMAGYTLSKLVQLEPDMRTLFADRFENWLIANL